VDRGVGLSDGARRRVAGLRRDEVPASAASHVAPALRRVLDRLKDTPALILSNLGETLVQNQMAVALLGDRSGYSGLARSEVYRWFTDHKTLIHPELGPIELDCQALFTEDQSQALLVLTAPPRTEGYEKLQLLAVLGQENFTGAPR
jgi:transcription regulator MmyB-like protein